MGARWSVLVALSALACTTTPSTPPAPPPEATAPLLGAWVSPCAPVQNADGTDGFAQSVLTLSAAAWSWDTGNFSDDACQTRIGAVRTDGSWQVERTSSTLPGAFDVRFNVSSRSVTPHVDGYMAFLEAMSCGQKPYGVGVAQDISAGGCPNLGVAAVTACPAEFDVAFAGPGGLQLGQRSAAPCAPTSRPSALGAPWTKR